MLRRALAWAALSIVALGAAGLTVDSLSPDALCPPVEETRAAVAARLGSVELDGTWHASYVLVHRTHGDFVKLSLRDPSGALRLERDLPVQGGSCATLSRVIALVLERFFMRPEQTAPAEPSEPAAAEAEVAPHVETPSEPAPAPLRPAPNAELAAPLARSPTAEERPASRRYRAGAAFWATNAWTAPQLSFDGELGGSYRLGLSAAFDLARHEMTTFDGDGAARLRRLPMAVSCGRGFDLSSGFRAEAALDVLGVLEAAHTTSLRDTGEGLRLVPGLGAHLGARFLAAAPVQPFAQLTAAWLLRAAAPAFLVAGQEVFAPPTLVFGLALGISAPF